MYVCAVFEVVGVGAVGLVSRGGALRGCPRVCW